MKIAGVRFRDNWRVYDFDATSIEVKVGDDVIVESDRGQGFARVVRLREGDVLPEPFPSGPEQKERGGGRKEAPKADEEIEIEVETPGSAAKAAQPAPPATPSRPVPKGYRKVVRSATEDDHQRAEKNRGREAEAFRTCQDMIAERELPMKLIRAEYSFDGTRVTFSFFSETRIDFRELVKDLAHKLRSRIDMRQVGVRDVARVIGGFGPCGRELCCTSFLRNFEPVSIRMAKKQEMVLNPAKISGVCGRLLCCLSYEFGMYDAIKQDLASMKEAVVREKREEQERRLAEQRREDEQRLAEEQQRRDDERRRQEQKQRDRERPAEQPKEGKKQDRKKPGRQEQKPRPPQEQKQRDKQPQQPARKPAPEAVAKAGEPAAADAEQAAQPGEGRNKRKRRFWRKKKKGGGPQQGPSGGGPAAGA
jgi:cell fate regulator YaaT (PSP1 superfamily)